MRQTSNHRIPTVPPGYVWAPTAIDLDPRDEANDPPSTPRNDSTHQEQAPRLSNRASPTQKSHEAPFQEAFPQEITNLSTDYWNDTYLEDLFGQENSEPDLGKTISPTDNTQNHRRNKRDSREASQHTRDRIEDLIEDDSETENLDGFQVDGFDEDLDNLFDDEPDDVDFNWDDFETCRRETRKISRQPRHHRRAPSPRQFGQGPTERHLPRSPDSSQGANERGLEPVFEQAFPKAFQQALSKIAATPKTSTYFSQVSELLDRAISRLVRARISSVLPSQLHMLRSLIGRYAAKGFDELDVLEDIVDLVNKDTLSHIGQLSPLLAGLSARVVLQPRVRWRSPSVSKRSLPRELQSSTDPMDPSLIDPSLLEALWETTEEAVRRLAHGGQLKVLPVLVASIGQVSVRDRHSAQHLPQQVQRAVAKVSQDPQLYQRLCRLRAPRSEDYFHSHPPSNSPETGPPRLSQQLRINGPAEIYIHHLEEKTGEN